MIELLLTLIYVMVVAVFTAFLLGLIIVVILPFIYDQWKKKVL